MSVVFGTISFVLYVYVLLIIGRIVVEVTRMFARTWRPAGTAAVGLELLYVTTDPPIRLLRRLIPPLRIGGVSLDLSVWILLIVIGILRLILERLA